MLGAAGPACYRKGGPLTITDANVFLGRILPAHFPHIFGVTEDQPLDYAASAEKFVALTSTINSTLEPAKQMSAQQVALGFIRVANEAMCRPIRVLTQAKGHNTTSHTLACFGGAGGQHACAIARNLGMTKIKAHRYVWFYFLMFCRSHSLPCPQVPSITLADLPPGFVDHISQPAPGFRQSH